MERPFFKPDLSHPSYADAVRRQLLEGNVGPGERVEEFAQAIKEYTGANHVLPTTSGTVALELVVRLVSANRVVTYIPGGVRLDFLGGPSKLTVGVPAYGEIATANTACSTGHKIYPIDIDLNTGCAHPQSVFDALSDGAVNAICYVNFSGATDATDIQLVQTFCDEAQIPFIEDSACGLGHWSGDKHAGTFGRFGTLSFSPHKLVTTGQGGAILCRDEKDYLTLKAYISHGNRGERDGTNLRMSDLQAALGCAQMARLPEILGRREAQFEALRERHSGLWKPDSGYPVHNIVFEGAPNNYKLLSDHPFYDEHKRLIEETCPNAVWWSRNAHYLPFGLGL